MALTVVTAAAINPVSLAEAKLHLRVDATTEDALIENLISAATKYCETFARRQFITATLKLNLDEFSDDNDLPIWLPNPPAQSVTSIKYYDENGTQQTWVASNYQVDVATEPARVLPAYNVSWPSTRVMPNAIEIIYKAGYGDKAVNVPAGIKAAIKLLVAHLFENREAASADSLNVVTFAIESLLWQHRILEFES